MKKSYNLKLNLLKVAIAAAIPLFASNNVFADATVYDTTKTTSSGAVVGKSGITSSALVLTGGGVDYTTLDNLGVSNATVTGYTGFVQGLGNTFTNAAGFTLQRGTSANITSSSTGSSYGILFGEYSSARASSSNVVNSGTALAGSTTATITFPSAATSSSNVGIVTATSLVGQTIVMPGELVDGEVRAGDTRTIVSATANGSGFDIVVDRAWTSSYGGQTAFNLLAGSGVNTLNNYGTIQATASGIADATLRTKYTAPTARGVDTNIAGDFIINNSGNLYATVLGPGTAQAIDAGGDVTSMVVNNESGGLIKSTRTEALTLTVNRYDFLRGTTTSDTNQSNIGSSAAIYSQEELETIEINNKQGATITGEGLLNPAIYMRAGAQTINNEGTINGSKVGSDYGMAIGSVSDSGEIRTLSLANSGTINGDILGVNANAYRWWALSNYSSSGTAVSDYSNADNRLFTNSSNWGQLDSTIENSGTITGKIYLSNGTHTITNTGVMVGNIDLDQRDVRVIQNGLGLTSGTAIQTAQAYGSNAATSVYAGAGAGGALGATGDSSANTIQTAIVKTLATPSSKSIVYTVYDLPNTTLPGTYTTDTTGLTASSTVTNTAAAATDAAASTSATYSGLFTVVGAKSFTFNNEGDYEGDILAFTSSSDALHSRTVSSDITLSPYIHGEGGSSAAAANTSNIHRFEGALKVVGASSNDLELVTIAPKSSEGTVVRSGQYYRVLDSVEFGTSYGSLSALTSTSTDLPEGHSNGLVSWTPSINGSGMLVVESNVDVDGVTGLHSKSKSALTALMSADSELGSQVQNLETAEDVRKASEQLRPEVNGATTQASMNVTDKVFGLVGSRLDEIHLASVAGRSGVATGNETRTADGTGVWMQAFGAKGSQDRRAGTDGYNTNAYGFAIGADQLIDDETRVGFVGSYGESTVNGLGDGTGNRTSIDTYQGAIYGSTMLRKLYLNATLGLGYHDYLNNRLVLDNGIKGTYDAWQYSGKLDAGYPIKLNAVTLVPVASLAYSRLSQNGYTETGVGALAIGSRDIDSFRSGLGAKALVPLIDSTVSAGLELRALWNHEFADSSIDSTARFVDGGASFTTNGVQLERDSASLGGSFRLYGVMDGVKQSLNVNYDAEIKSQYINQTASLQARFDF
ncbi:MAG: hypothetical protein RJB18_749 [Pseudomonadota bacterium]|jgi:outer membrane autotransporter protein